MGQLEVRKYLPTITTEGKKIKTNLPIDWNATLKLWYEDKEAYEDRFLVRINVPEIYKIFYNKNLANYNNKSFYQFTPNRDLKELSIMLLSSFVSLVCLEPLKKRLRK